MRKAMNKLLTYNITDPLELNLSYITFVNNGGLFIPTKETYVLGEIVEVNLNISNKQEIIKIEGRVIWITPSNALYHSLAGIGIQFMGDNTKAVRAIIESHLTPSMSVGGYTCGITETKKDVKAL